MNSKPALRYDKDRVKAAAAGSWIAIFVAAGVPRDSLDGKGHPCPRCGGTDRFSAFKDVATRGAVLCRNCFSKECGDGFSALMWMKGCDFLEAVRFAAHHLGVAPIGVGSGEPTLVSDAVVRNQGYQLMLGRLELSPEHRDALRQRGMSDERIDAAKYRTLPQDTRSLVAYLLEKLGESFNLVPGLGRARIHAPPGLLVPVRDINTQIIAIKVRPDKPMKDGSKYVYLSSVKDGGPSPGAPAHVPMSVRGPSEVVRITEGELKADAATASSGVPTISFPGVSLWRVALPVLKELGARTVRVAFDADARDKQQVARSLRECIEKLQADGYEVELETWQPEQGKGIDDLLVGGGMSEVLSGEDVVNKVREIAAAAGVKELDAPKRDRGDGRDGERRTSQADMLVNIAEQVKLFHTPGAQDSEAYASMIVAGHRESWPVKAKGFRRWLAREFFLETGKVPGSQGLQDALNVIAGSALFDGPEHSVALRVAQFGGSIWLDLADSEWQAVEITPNGWSVRQSDRVPIRFVRRRGQLPLPSPIPGGALEELRPLVNLQDDDSWVLFAAWLVMSLNPAGPYPVLGVSGEAGSAKSTICKFARALIDPNVVRLRRPPRNEHDLVIAANNNWIVGLDNLSGVPVWLSDAICALATGGGFGTRELFSDDEEKLFDAMRPVIINGIENVATRSDLLDRMVNLTLPIISDESRLDEKALKLRFEDVHPRVLGALLDGVSAALREREFVSLESKPRMADFAIWATAAEGGLGLEQGRFMAAYDDNRNEANHLAIESSVIGPPVVSLIADQRGFDGTFAELLKTLTERADDRTTSQKSWPRSARKLSGELRRIAPNLRKVGINVSVGGHTRKGTPVSLENVHREPSQPSPSSQCSARTDFRRDDPVTVADDEIRGPSRSKSSSSRCGDECDDVEREIPNCSDSAWGEV